jgi:hypothetical protein
MQVEEEEEQMHQDQLVLEEQVEVDLVVKDQVQRYNLQQEQLTLEEEVELEILMEQLLIVMEDQELLLLEPQQVLECQQVQELIQ